MSTSHPHEEVKVFHRIVPPSLCQLLIDTYDKDEDLAQEEVYGKGHNVQANYLLLNNPKYKSLDEKVFKIVDKVVNKLRELDKFITISGSVTYQLRKIYGATRLHVDGPLCPTTNQLRNVSLIMALNSNYEGGLFHFPKQDLHLRLEAGDVITFPVYFTHPHEVAAPINDTYRYTINTWLTQ